MFHINRRINRTTFFAGFLLSFALLIIGTSIIEELIEELSLTGAAETLLGLLTLLALLFTIMYWFCLLLARVRDILDEYTILMAIIGLLGNLPIMIVLGLIPGSPKPNLYGNVPHKGIHLTTSKPK